VEQQQQQQLGLMSGRGLAPELLSRLNGGAVAPPVLPALPMHVGGWRQPGVLGMGFESMGP
jgi:hypothetical protein